MNIGNWMSAARRKRDLSTSDTAELVGISVSVYNKLETAETPVRPVHYVKFCKVLNLDPLKSMREFDEFTQFSPAKLKDELKRQGLEPKELAHRVRATAAAITYFLMGAVPTDDKLQRIADALEVPRNILVEPFGALVRHELETGSGKLTIARRKKKATKSRITLPRAISAFEVAPADLAAENLRLRKRVTYLEQQMKKLGMQALGALSKS